MIRWFAAFALLVLAPAVASAQVSAPTKILPPLPHENNDESDVQPGSAKPIGPRICSGFPDKAVQQAAHGNTVVSFTVTTEGKVADVLVSKSSGNTILDNAAQLCVKGWLYQPAVQGGHPVATSQQALIRWALADDPDNAKNSTTTITAPVWKSGGFNCEGWHLNPRPPHSVILSFFVETDGSVKDVTISQSSTMPDVDADAVECLNKRQYRPAKRADGTPVEIHISDWLY